MNTISVARNYWTAERVKLKPGERKKKGTGLKILTPSKLLIRLPILLAQIKAGNKKSLKAFTRIKSSLEN